MALNPFSDLLLQKDSRIIASIPIESIDFDIKDGDLAFVSDADSIKESLVRRLRTPIKAYEIFVSGYTEEGTINHIYYDSLYGSDLYTYISEPLTNSWIRHFTDTATRIIAEDTRISIVDVNLNIINLTNGQINLSITYEISGTDDTQVLNIGSTGSGSITITPVGG